MQPPFDTSAIGAGVREMFAKQLDDTIERGLDFSGNEPAR